MNFLFRRAAVLCLALAATPVWSDADVIGTLDAFDGTVTVIRSGTAVDSDKVDTGFLLENNDQIRVSSDGWADIALDTKTGIKASMHVKAGTSVLLDLSSLAQTQTGSLDLLLGSIALKVQKMVGGNALDVHTETASMGVRGTVFGVDTEVDGAVLLTTTEGRVELTPDTGDSHFSVPGTAVSSDGEETSQWTDAAVSDSAAYINGWHQDRLKLFEQRRERILARLADRYQWLETRFEAAHRRLEENRELWQTWGQEEQKGQRSGAMTNPRLRARVLANLVMARRLAWSLERVQQRLTNIETRLGPDAFFRLNIPLAHGNWQDFVKIWRDGSDTLEAKLALTHYRVKLFALRHGPLQREARPERL
jgi:hypothetical protein